MPKLSSMLATFAAASQAQWDPVADDPLSAYWTALNTTVGGRLFQGTPFAKPCFGDELTAQCASIRAGYTDEWTRASTPGAWINTQWETCQASGAQCLLGDIDNGSANGSSASCEQGSVPLYFIDVREPGDAVAGFQFSRDTGVPIVVKNTGHDYKGRSSAPGSLGLWTHNLKNISLEADFVPEGCGEADSVGQAVTVGAGAQWADGYAFAEENNITLVGGSDRSVGMVGGWLQGGGHGMLSVSMGLGVDRVLQYRVVTPDGNYRVANRCQNEDLFWALRGGGGGTFGVVMEATILASPRVTLQTVTVIIPAGDKELSRRLWSVMVANGVRWAEEGWGANAVANFAVYVNPMLDNKAAAKSMEPFLSFQKQLESEGHNATVLLIEAPSWGTFFEAFSTAHVAAVGNSLALASRLINRDNFATSEDQGALVEALLAADEATPGLIILATAPTAFPSTGNETSVTPLWRESVYHVTVVSPWEADADIQEKQAHYARASASIDNLREITKQGAYSNEADVNEPNYQTSFWGDNHAELLSIKHKYDPEGLLNCWQCVGWNPDDARYRCYL